MKARTRLALLAILALSAALSLTWSHAKLLNQDEIFVLQTDSAPSLAQVVHIQLHYPISLDPIVYHAFVHLSTRLFGVNPFALRLPSLLGFLLMQVCLFLFVRRALSSAQTSADAAALFAAAFPIATATLFYSAEARPYGLLLGLYALAVYSWQSATRDVSSRRWSLPLFALSIALALNSHYFAILLLPILFLAELVRTVDRRRLDAPLLAALLLGTACIAFTLPFQKAAGEFRRHYYNSGLLGIHAITQAYRALFVNYTLSSMRVQHFAVVLLSLAALAAAVGLIARWRSLQLPRGESTLLVTLSALPVFGFLLARFVTHSIEVRYVLGAIIGITIFLSLALAPWLSAANSAGLRHSYWKACALALIIPAAALINIHREQSWSTQMLRSLEPSPAVRAAIAADPTRNLYIQQTGMFEIAQYYQPDPVLRAHTVLVYSFPREILFNFHDTEALTAEHLTHFTALPIVRYEDLIHDPATHTWVIYHSGWDWTDAAFAGRSASQFDDDRRALVTPLGPMFSGDAVSVRFSAQ